MDRRFFVAPAALAVLALSALLGTACGGGGEAEETLTNLEGQLDALEVDAARLTTSQAPFLPDPPEGMVTLKIDFAYYQEGLPARIEVHEPAGDADRLFAMESLEAGAPVPMGDLIENGIIFVTPGELKLVELVYQNPTDELNAFMAIAPSFDPVAAHPFAYARCFCAALRFEVPPGGTWYRTIAVGTAPQVPPGSKVIVTWPVIPLPQEQEATMEGGTDADAS